MFKLASCVVYVGFILLSAVPRLDAATPQVSLYDYTASQGVSDTFSVAVQDAAGSSDLAGMNLLINSAFDGSSGCWIYYDFQQKQLSIYGDNGWGTASSRCSTTVPQVLAGFTSSEVPLTVQFSASWAGPKTIWARASDLSGNDSGYVQVGTYTVAPGSMPDFVVGGASTQTVRAGNSAVFALALTAVNGYKGTILVSSQLSGPGASSMAAAFVSPITLPIPANPPIEQVTVSFVASTSAITPPGPVTDTITFSDGTITHTATVTLSVLSNSTPIISVEPPSTNFPDFVINVSPAGSQSLAAVDFLINSSFSGTNGCWLAWTPNPNATEGSGMLGLASDDTSTWSQIAVGPSPNLAPLGNSQCSLPAGSVTSSTGGGKTLNLVLALQVSAPFAGVKNLYADVTDQDGGTTGYLPEGAWNTTSASSAPADFQIALTPGSQTIEGGKTATLSATVSPFADFTGTVSFNVTGLPPGAVLTPPAPTAPGIPSPFTIQTPPGEPAGDYTITVTGMSGNLSHSTQAQLNVYNGVPSAWFSPAGAVATNPSPYAWMYLSTDPLGAQNVSSLDILLNNTVSGQNACWIYFDGVVPWLASDDGSVWTRIPGGPGTTENSQCTANFGGIVPGYFGVVLTISFKSGFTPANLYEDAVNKEGGNSGYLLQTGMPTSAPN